MQVGGGGGGSQLSSEIVAPCLTGFEKSVHVHCPKWRFTFVAFVGRSVCHSRSESQL